MKKRVSIFSIVSLIIGIVSTMMFWLLLSKEVGFLYVPWLISGTISIFFPILSKYLRKRSGRKGVGFESAAIILGFFNFYWVLSVATKWHLTIIYLLCVLVCILYVVLFKKTTPIQKEKDTIVSENENNKQNEKKRFFIPIAVVLSIITCWCSLFLFIDALILDEFENGFGWIGMFVVYSISTFLFWVNYKRKNCIVAILCFCVTSFLSFGVIQIGLLETAFDFSLEAVVAFFIVFFLSLSLCVFSIIDLFKANWKFKFYYKSMRYREKCYKKVARMKEYLDNGIITQEEFEKNKAEILKKIEM